MKVASYILPTIVCAQFCCTSLWFAGNAIMSDLVDAYGLSGDAIGHLTSAVQLGFIVGTFIFALLSLADRISPSLVFFVCALSGGLINLAMVYGDHTLYTLIGIRFLTGCTLAGIYPVGMKIASDYYNTGLGRSLGYLVGALVLGTALPHLLKSLGSLLPWGYIIYGTSILAMLGGLMIYLLVADGPYRKRAERFDPSALLSIFRMPKFRSAALGYFGHMWELYAFWAFVPVLLIQYERMHEHLFYDRSLLAFMVIGVGSLSCIAGGYIAERWGAQRVAYASLNLSMVCCLVSPLFFYINSPMLFLTFLVFWGMVVIADSPLFSTLVARHAPEASRASALTIVNCIGFSITIVSIQLLNTLSLSWSISSILALLAIGPAIALINNFGTNYTRQKLEDLK